MSHRTKPKNLLKVALYAPLYLLLFISSPPLWALESDRLQPVHIESEYATADYKNGFTVYSGKVKLSQGSLIIEADEITIRRGKDGAGVSSVVAIGKPAHFQQQPELKKPPIHARANQITYNVPKETLELQDDVHIDLAESTHQGSQFQYNIKTQVLNASGVKGSRVKVTFLPPAAPHAEKPTPTPPPEIKEPLLNGDT